MVCFTVDWLLSYIKQRQCAVYYTNLFKLTWCTFGGLTLFTNLLKLPFIYKL